MSAETRTPARKRRKDARPDEILEAAFDIFAEHGFAATRMEDVAARAGVAKGTIYLYFATKEALFEGVVRRSFAPLVESFEGLNDEAWARDEEETLRHIIESVYRELVATRRRLILRLLISEAARFPGLVSFYFRAIIAPGRRALATILDHGIEKGALRPGLFFDRPEILIAPAAMAALWTLIFDEVEPLDAERFQEAHIDLVLRALKAPDLTDPRAPNRQTF